jgi:hypothetical protein
VDSIGGVLCVGGLGLAVFQMICFPWLAQRVGVLWILRTGNLLAAPFLFLLPYVASLRGWGKYAALLAVTLAFQVRQETHVGFAMKGL